VTLSRRRPAAWPSYYNRTGQHAGLSVVALSVDDQILAGWRMTHGRLTIVPGRDTLCCTSCTGMRKAGFDHSAHLTRPEERAANLGVMCDQIHDIVVPWFASTREPAALPGLVPGALLGPFAFAVDLAGYLISRGEPDQARALIQRVLASEPMQRDAWSGGS
jgi:hypothetical protein